MMYDPVTANPLHGNPLRTRADVERALRTCFSRCCPISPRAARGCGSTARRRISTGRRRISKASPVRSGADPAGRARGRVRPLGPLPPGLANGTDPEHPEYWGEVNSTDQRMVELAAIGFAMRMLPHLVWEPLPQKAKDNLAAYLLHARRVDYADNNWKFFRILVTSGSTNAAWTWTGR